MTVTIFAADSNLYDLELFIIKIKTVIWLFFHRNKSAEASKILLTKGMEVTIYKIERKKWKFLAGGKVLIQTNSFDPESFLGTSSHSFLSVYSKALPLQFDSGLDYTDRFLTVTST